MTLPTKHNILYQLILWSILVWLIYNLANLFWLAMDFYVPKTPLFNQASPNDNLSSNKKHLPLTDKINLTTIIDAQLFGKDDIIKKKTVITKRPSAPLMKVPETRLNLKLMGISFSTGSIASSAIVVEGNGLQKIVTVDDKLLNGQAKVHEINSKHLVIFRQGKYETLTLFSLLKSKKNSFIIHPKSSKNTNKHFDLTTNRVISNKLKHYKSLALKDPMSLNSVMNIYPLYFGDNFKGFKINPGRDRVLFQQSGLQSGDILLSVNNVQLDQPSKVLSLLSVLSNAKYLDLTVDRSGNNLSFQYLF